MTHADTGFTIRPLAFDADRPALARLLAAIEAVDQEGEDVSEAGLREQFAAWGASTADNCWVALAPEDTPDDNTRFIGWGSVWKTPSETHADIQVAVHPAWRRRGLGGTLLDRALARLRAVGATAAGAYAASTNEVGNRFLRTHGFAPAAAYTEMRVPGARAYPSIAWPDGFTVQPYSVVGDVAALTQAMNASYAGLWGHHTVTAEQISEWLPEWDPDGLLLLFDAAGQVAGMCRAEMSARLSARRGQPTGYIDAPGIVPAWRAHSLHVPLLLSALAWLKSHQPAAIELESWGDRPETLALYEGVGFAVTRQARSYRLELR